MFHVVLYQPEIPPNTGNVIRLCANSGCRLHLVQPLGFDIDDRSLRRAGLDYREWMTMQVHEDFDQCLQACGKGPIFTFSTHHTHRYDQGHYVPGSILVFGPETRGLPEPVRDCAPETNRVIIPMDSGSRSLNLSNSVAIAVYEALRQQDFTSFS